MPSAPTTSLPLIIIRRPLLTVATASEALDRSSYEVIEWIESGKIRFAWNLSLRCFNKRTVRILAQSLAEAQRGQTAPRISEAEEWGAVCQQIFPFISASNGAVTTILAATLARRFNVKSQHVLALCRERTLRFAAGTRCRRGPTGSPRIEFASVVEFLKQRRMT